MRRLVIEHSGRSIGLEDAEKICRHLGIVEDMLGEERVVIAYSKLR